MTTSEFVNRRYPEWDARRRPIEIGREGSRFMSAAARAATRHAALWIERARQRKALAGLDDHMLRDIGITRVEAVRESGKPFWR